MISLKLSDVVLLSETGAVLLPGIQNVLRAKRVPIKAMYQLSKIGKQLIGEVADFIEARTALVKDLGEEVMQEVPDGDPAKPGKQVPTGNFRVKLENNDAFLAKQNELLDVDVQIDLNPVKVSELGEQIEGLTSADLIACSFFIVDDAV